MPRVIRAEVMRLRMLNGARAAEVFQPCASSFFCLMNAKNVITMQHVGASLSSDLGTESGTLCYARQKLFNP